MYEQKNEIEQKEKVRILNEKNSTYKGNCGKKIIQERGEGAKKWNKRRIEESTEEKKEKNNEFSKTAERSEWKKRSDETERGGEKDMRDKGK